MIPRKDIKGHGGIHRSQAGAVFMAEIICSRWHKIGTVPFSGRLLASLFVLIVCGIPIPGQGADPLPYEQSRFGIFGAYSASEYDVFKTRMGFDNAQYWDWADHHFSNLAARWTRSTVQLIWDQIEPTLDAPYNWNTPPFLTDSVITNIYNPGNQILWLGVFHEGNLFGGRSGRSPLSDTNRYCRFVRAAVERYSRGRASAVNTNVQVRYWQIGNEAPNPPNPEKRSNYVNWVKTTVSAIRATDPDARIVLTAAIANPLNGMWFWGWSSNVVHDLADGNWFDAIDVHFWSSWDKYKMPDIKAARQYLDDMGKTNVHIWSGENGTWVGHPTGQQNQTEEDQARGLVRRYVYNIDLGLDKLFWNNLVEWANFMGDTGSIFNAMGLIGDGLGNGEATNSLNVPRLSYHTYKRLAAAIDTDQARYAGKMTVHQESNLYAYCFQSLSTNRANRYILWRDAGTQSVTFAINTRQAEVNSLITDTLGNPRTAYVANVDSQGNLTVEVGLDPLLVEENLEPPRIREIVMQPDGTLRLEMESVAGRPFVVEVSTNLSRWIPLCTNTPAAVFWSSYDDDVSNFPCRFYRFGPGQE